MAELRHFRFSCPFTPPMAMAAWEMLNNASHTNEASIPAISTGPSVLGFIYVLLFRIGRGSFTDTICFLVWSIFSNGTRLRSEIVAIYGFREPRWVHLDWFAVITLT